MNSSAIRVEDHFPQEVPSFRPPLPETLAHIETRLDDYIAESEVYFREREAFVSFWEKDVDNLEDIVTRFSLTGGDPKLDALIDQAGEHLERTRSGMQPEIKKAMELRQKATALGVPRAKRVLTSSIDRNISIMQRYIKAAEAAYDLLIELRDRSIQQSVGSLAEKAWAGVWDNDD